MFKRYWFYLVRLFWHVIGRRDAGIFMSGTVMGHTMLSNRYILLSRQRRFWVWQKLWGQLTWQVDSVVNQTMLLEHIHVLNVRFVTSVAVGYPSNTQLFDLLCLPVHADMLHEARLNYLVEPGTIIKVECVL